MPNCAWPGFVGRVGEYPTFLHTQEVISSSLRPAHRPLERLARAIVRRRMLEAFVEHHRDIRSELRLDVDGRFGRQQMLAAVEMRAKRRPFLVHFAPRGKTEDLIAAAVGEDRLVPADEPVKAAECADARGARPQIEMIGIGEDDLRAQVVEIAMRHRLHGALRADRHEGRRVHDAVRRRQHAAPRGAVRVRDFKTEHQPDPLY